MRRVLLTDCSPEVLQALAAELSDHFNVHTCSYGPDVLEEYLTFQPDLLVLDTTMPGCDAAGMLRTVWSRDVETKVLATACGFNDSMTDMLAKVPYLLIKPYDSSVAAARLGELEQLLDQNAEEMLFDRVNAILQELGIERNRVGFSCLAEAVMYWHDNPDCLFTDDLYPHTAKVCGGSAQSVDKAMKRCIITAWRKRNPLIWDHYFGTSTLCPTNVRFIRAIARAIDKS